MRYGWDEGKRRRNIATHRVDFAAVDGFEWETSLRSIDDRFEYGETREVAIGFIGVRLHVLVFAERDEIVWVISLRKAEKREIRRYVEATR
jgi:uncharacterized DUF497 family protein